MSNEGWIDITRHTIGKHTIVASVKAGETQARFEVVHEDNTRVRITAEDAIAIINVDRPAGT